MVSPNPPPRLICVDCEVVSSAFETEDCVVGDEKSPGLEPPKLLFDKEASPPLPVDELPLRLLTD